MLKVNFEENKFTLEMSLEIFHYLWDDSYSDLGNYDVRRFKEDLGINDNLIDLDSFINDQAFVDDIIEDGYDACNCFIKEIKNDVIFASGLVRKL